MIIVYDTFYIKVEKGRGKGAYLTGGIFLEDWSLECSSLQ